MAHQTTLPSGATLTIENRGDQTSLSFHSGNAGQQQSQANSFSTGVWTHPPTLFQTQTALILRIEGERHHYLSIENGSARCLENAPDLRDARTLPLQRVEDEPEMAPMQPMTPMQPLKPMAPMKPLEPMKPMEMRLGSMQMSMGGVSKDAPREPTTIDEPRAAFCTSCGQAAREGDRFCAKCGHELRVL